MAGIRITLNQPIEFDLSSTHVVEFFKHADPLEKVTVLTAIRKSITEADIKELEEFVGHIPANKKLLDAVRAFVKDA